LSCLAFVMSLVPQANYAITHSNMPVEILPLLFFFLALVFIYKRGSWKTQTFEYTLVICVLCSLLAQMPLAASSAMLSDGNKLFSQGLKVLAYMVVSIGLFVDVIAVFRRADGRSPYVASIVESSVDGIITVDSSGAIQTYNTAAAKMFGYDPSEVLSQDISMLMPEKERAEYASRLNRLTLVGPTVSDKSHNLRGLKKDGNSFALELSVSKMNAGGDEDYIGIFRDVTERILSHDALMAATDALDRSLAATKTGAWTWNIEENTIVRGDSWYNVYGYSDSDFDGKTGDWSKGIHPEDRDSLIAVSQKLKNDLLESYEIEVRRRLEGGEYMWTMSRGQITRRDAKGKPLTVSGTDTDISASMGNRLKLEALNSVLSAISEIESDFISGMDTKLLFDRILSNILKFTHSEYGFIGKICNKGAIKYLKTYTITDISWDKGSKKFYQDNASSGLELYNMDTLFGRVILTGQAVICNHYAAEGREGVLPEGHPALNSFLGIPIYTSDRTLSGMVGIANAPQGYDKNTLAKLEPIEKSIATIMSSIQDRENRNIAEQALRRSAKMDAVGQLAGGVAHDFNNLLGIMLGNIEMIELTESVNAAVQKRLDSIKRSSLRAADLTSHLLGFSRRQTTDVEEVDVGDRISKVKGLLKRSLTPEITLNYHLCDTLPPVEMNGGDFDDALLNLVINARDATNGSGVIEIKLAQKYLDQEFCNQAPVMTAGEHIVLTVRDRGEGISPEAVAEIFDPFYTTKPTGKGTGLGLAMVFAFVERSRGYVECVSELGVGTTFNVYLPCIVSNSGVVMDCKTSRAQVEGAVAGMEQILVVDDEADLREYYGSVLTKLGYQVTLVSNADAALAMLESSSNFQLLFSDVIMPGRLNGFDLAKAATKLNGNIKVLLTSGYTGESSDGIQSSKYSNVLKKPFTIAELSGRIRALVT